MKDGLNLAGMMRLTLYDILILQASGMIYVWL